MSTDRILRLPRPLPGTEQTEKFLEVDDAAVALWFRAICYCNRRRTDGMVSAAALRPLSLAKRPIDVAEQLVTVGLWELVKGGWLVIGALELWRSVDADDWSTDAYPEVYARDGQSCRYCGGDADLTIGHVVPRCQGGSDKSENLVVACRSCNSRKGGMTPAQARMVIRVPEATT